MGNFYHTILINLHRIIFYVTKARIWLLNPDKHSDEERYGLVNEMVSKMNKSAGFKTIGYGQENLPKEGGYMLYPNHQGKYDVCGIFATHEKPLSFVMDKKRSKMVLVNEVLGLLKGKTIPLNNAKEAMKVFFEISKELAEGRIYILFPEGGYKENNSNVVEPFKAGSFKLAKMAKVPIVPVALVDSYKVYNSPERGPVTTYTYYLDPIYYDEYKDLKTKDIALMVENRIRAKIEEHLQNVKDKS